MDYEMEGVRPRG